MSEITCKTTTTKATTIIATITTTITTRGAENHERETNCAQNCHQMTNAWQHQSAAAATAAKAATPAATATETETMAAHCRRRRQQRSDAGRATASATAAGFQLLLLASLSVLAAAMTTSKSTLTPTSTSTAVQHATKLEVPETKENPSESNSTVEQLSELSVNNITRTASTPLATPLTTPSSTPPGIRENVMLPSSDPEREAQILYEKSLQEYHGSQRATEMTTFAAGAGGDADRGNGSGKSSTQRTLHSVCELWLQKHCHCTGSLGNLKLSCRSIGILAVPVNMPSEVLVL